MSKPAITVEVLPAGFGDCVLLSCPAGDRTWRMLIDTGPDEAYPALRNKDVGSSGHRFAPHAREPRLLFDPLGSRAGTRRNADNSDTQVQTGLLGVGNPATQSSSVPGQLGRPPGDPIWGQSAVLGTAPDTRQQRIAHRVGR